MRKITSAINNWTGRLARSNAIPGQAHQGHVAGMAVATTLAYRLPMPSGPVERPEEWYIINCHAGAEDAIAEINEGVTMLFDEVVKLTRKIWLMRYRVAHVPFSEDAMNAMMSVVDSNTQDIAPVYKEFLQTHAAGSNFRHVVHDLGNLMDEIGLMGSAEA